MIEIIPAIDVMDGKCVRLTQGDFAQRRTYAHDPVEVAMQFENAGLRRLHIVDLDGAKTGIPSNIHVLEAIAGATELLIDYGGGIKTDDDIKWVFDAGAKIVNLGSVAVTDPELFFEWTEHYGGESILLGADVRDGMVAINGWQTETDFPILSFLREYYCRGVEQAFVTDIAKDGVLQGPALDLYEDILTATPDLKLIASGGVSTLDDVAQLHLIGCSGVIVGKAIYEGRIALDELAKYACSQNG